MECHNRKTNFMLPRMSLVFLCGFFVIPLSAQKATNHQDDKILNEKITPAEIKQTLDRILLYLDNTTQAVLVNSTTGREINDLSNPDKEAVIKPGDFKLQRYEWGAVYNAMLLAGNIFEDR